MKRIPIVLVLVGVLALGGLAGCETATPTQKGAMGGAAVGALAGQAIGGNTSSTMIGATAGALGGALLNDHMSQQK